MEDLKYHDISDNQTGYCVCQFQFKPTERSRTKDGKDFYWDLLYLKTVEAFTQLTVLVLIIGG